MESESPIVDSAFSFIAHLTFKQQHHGREARVHADSEDDSIPLEDALT